MADADREIWSKVLLDLNRRHPAVGRHWFNDLEPLGIHAGVLHVRCQQDVHRNYLLRQVEAFDEAVQSATGQLLSVRFWGPDDAEAPSPAPEPTPARAKARPAQPRSNQPRAASPIPAPTHHDHANHTTQRATAPGAHGAPSLAEPKLGHAHTAHHADGHAASHNHAPHTAAPPQRIANITPPVLQPPRRIPDSDSLLLNPDWTFEHFIIGAENNIAHAAALAVANNPGLAYNPLFIHGASGLGKTHLLQAICQHLLDTKPGIRICYISCEQFINRFIDDLQNGRMHTFRDHFRNADVLMIDDIQFLAKRDHTQEEFFHTFNALHQAQRQIVLSSDCVPEEIPELESRLVSRFRSGLVVPTKPPTYETRIRIVKAKARIRGMDISTEVAEYIASRINSNIRELEGAIVRLHVQSAAENQPPDLAIAKLALGDSPSPSSGEVTIHQIVDVVTRHYGVKVTELQSKRKQKSIALPRQICMYLTRKHTRYSLEEIGGHFGGRDHTTVMHAVKTIESKRHTDDSLARALEVLEEPFRKLAAPGAPGIHQDIA
ncbi:MAG: chromosomal replication initiator protein DnaA [Phycisphaerales bacterium]